MASLNDPFDVIMLGTFSVWRLGTLQARALPLARGLSRRGLRVALATMPWDAPAEAGVRETCDGVTILNTRSSSLAAAPALVHETAGWIERQHPGIVHVFKPKGFGGLVARRLLGRLPVVVDSDDWEGDGGWNDLGRYHVAQRRLFDWQERALIARADAVTAASALLQQRARQLRHAHAAGAVWRLPNALDDAWISALAPGAPASAPDDDVPTVLLYSRYAEFGPVWLPRFVTALADRVTRPVRFQLVGDAPAVASVGHVRVQRLGYVAREALPTVLGGATLAVYPFDDSLVSRAKQSVKLLELMAAGCPVVASAVGDVAPTLGGAGLALRDATPDDFARETARLLAAPDELVALRAVGPPRVRAHYRFPALVETLLEIYGACALTAHINGARGA